MIGYVEAFFCKVVSVPRGLPTQQRYSSRLSKSDLLLAHHRKLSEKSRLCHSEWRFKYIHMHLLAIQNDLKILMICESTTSYLWVKASQEISDKCTSIYNMKRVTARIGPTVNSILMYPIMKIKLSPKPDPFIGCSTILPLKIPIASSINRGIMIKEVHRSNNTSLNSMS